MSVECECVESIAEIDDDHKFTSNHMKHSSTITSSPSKNRRKRRKANRNKTDKTNAIIIESISKTPRQADDHEAMHAQTFAQPTSVTKCAIAKKSNHAKPKTWRNQKNSSALHHIMNEQRLQQQPTYGFTEEELSGQSLLEQQMILQAIAESTRSQLVENGVHDGVNDSVDEPDQKTDDSHPKPLQSAQIDDGTTTTTNTNGDHVTPEHANDNNTDATNELLAASLQNDEDKLLALRLQKQEEKALLRQQKMSKMYDGKFAKVTSAESQRAAIPDSALQFCYDDESILNGGRTKQQFEQQKQQQPPTVQSTSPPSKHDAKKWSAKHLHRLNEYETGGDFGDLDSNLTMSNQCYNNFRNQLEKKGFISYHNFQLEPSSKRKRS